MASERQLQDCRSFFLPDGPHPAPRPLTTFTVGSGEVEANDRRYLLQVPPGDRGAYHDAQLHDYAGIPRVAYPWRAPLMLTLRARMSSEVRGTAGFGFWNNPLAPLGGVPALPQAAWFLFASPPSAMELAQDVPGFGWKAAVMDAARPQALAWAPFAPLVLLACRRRAWRRRIWPRVQRALAIEEAELTVERSAWHTYELFWFPDRVIFGVDGHVVLRTAVAPRGPLGLVIWIDNQWARVTPAGSFGWGVLDLPQFQWLECADIQIVSGA